MNTSSISSARPIVNSREAAANGTKPAAAGTPGPAAAHSSQAAVSVETLNDPAPAPVDHERVALIRKAVSEGHYPVVPAKIADAIIAAGMLLRASK